jgi:hypothetical protein
MLKQRERTISLNGGSLLHLREGSNRRRLCDPLWYEQPSRIT